MPAISTTHVCRVLDRSGSIGPEGFTWLCEHLLQDAKQNKDLYEARFSMIMFSSESVDTIRKNEL
jgi:hypothetical protein